MFEKLPEKEKDQRTNELDFFFFAGSCQFCGVGKSAVPSREAKKLAWS